MRRPARGATLDEIEAMYRARLPEFRRVAAAILGDRDLARDAVQEGFALAVRERATFRGKGSLEAWLWRIVVNAALGHRRRRSDEDVMPEDLAPHRNGVGEGPEEQVRAALALLPERQRLVLFLRYYADLDYRAIADSLEISVGTVGATLNAAHAATARLLGGVTR